MQDELLKHTEKIYKISKKSEHSFLIKAREILIEICIIVFAVTLSIWLHNKSEHRHQQAEIKDFLIDLKVYLAKDTQSLMIKKNYLSISLQTYTQIQNLTPAQVDTANNLSLNFNLSTLKTNDGNYEGFKSSGKIGFIENKKLKALILEYYEETLPNLYDIAKYHYSKELETFEMINAFNKPRNKLLSDPAIRSKINLNAVISQSLLGACDQTIDQAVEIMKEIDADLK